MSQASRYSGLQIGLHWAIALLIGINWLTGEAMISAFDGMIEGEAGKVTLQSTSHVWFGVAIIALTLLRLLVRRAHGKPAKNDQTSPLLHLLGELAHWGLYALLIAVPALGAIAWFGGIEDIGDLHVLIMNAMLIVIGLHAAAGIFHHYVLKDGLLHRMSPIKG